PKLPSFPTRRSSDLNSLRLKQKPQRHKPKVIFFFQLVNLNTKRPRLCWIHFRKTSINLALTPQPKAFPNYARPLPIGYKLAFSLDRKSTRLNSSHVK